MSDPYRCIGSKSLNVTTDAEQPVTMDKSDRLSADEDEISKHWLYHRMIEERNKLPVGEFHAILHRSLQHYSGAPILLYQGFDHSGKSYYLFILFKGCGNALKRLSILFSSERCFAHLIEDYVQADSINNMLAKQITAIVYHLGLHTESQAHSIRVACVGGKVCKRHFCRLCLAGCSLRTEFFRLLFEFLNIKIAAANIILACKGNEGICHKQVFISLIGDCRLGVLHREFAKGGIGIFSRSCVLCAVGNVFRRIVNKIEGLFANRFVGGLEPGYVKCAEIQFLVSQGGKSRYHSLALIIKPLIHVRHKVIAHGGKGVYTEIFADYRYPLGRIKSCFNKALLRNLLSFKGGSESIYRITLSRNTY